MYSVNSKGKITVDKSLVNVISTRLSDSPSILPDGVAEQLIKAVDKKLIELGMSADA